MTGKTHHWTGWMIGAGAGAVDFKLGLPLTLPAVGCVVGGVTAAGLGAIAPDLDIRRSTANFRLRRGTRGIPVLGWIVDRTPWTRLLTHRGLLHLWARGHPRLSYGLRLGCLLLALGLTLRGLTTPLDLLPAAFLLGVLSHLLLDWPLEPGRFLEWLTRFGSTAGLVALVLALTGEWRPLAVAIGSLLGPAVKR